MDDKTINIKRQIEIIQDILQAPGGGRTSHSHTYVSKKLTHQHQGVEC